ncbi:hypothetical protein JTB14_011709 [Gonioctena quinquepunctata]|nr:hypothetical protein JTB14_011709 [Gonioctena quinquepunctata]
MYGKDWLYSFMCRNPQLSFRKPEVPSLSTRLPHSTKEIDVFFKDLESLLTNTILKFIGYATLTKRIFPMFTIQVVYWQKKEEKQVGAITSGGRGQNTTIVFCFHAPGQYIPPMFICERMRMKDGLEKMAPQARYTNVRNLDGLRKSCLQKYMKSRDYEKIRVTDIAKLFGKAYNRITTIEKASKGFKTTGIFPINRDAF